MKVKLVRGDGEVLFEGTVPKAAGIVCRVEDPPAEGQFEFNGKHLHVSGDGGGSHPTWEVEVGVPRVKEPSA